MHPTVQATTGPGVQAEVSLSVDPRVPWGARKQWNFTDHLVSRLPFISCLDMLCSVPLHYISPPSGGQVVGQSWRSRHRGVRLDNSCYHQSHSISSWPCVYKTLSVLLLYVCSAGIGIGEHPSCGCGLSTRSWSTT